MEFTYRREGCRPFPEMVEAVERSVRSHGFAVVRVHDLQATLAAKGFAIQPLVVLDVALCDAGDDLCKMHVYADGDTVWVSAMRPFSIWGPDPRAGLAPGPESSVVSLVDDACER